MFFPAQPHKQLCWHRELERGTTAPTWSTQSAKNPFNTTSASPDSAGAQAPTQCRSRAVKIPKIQRILCSSAGASRGSHANDLHKSQWWSKGCVYPRSKDCLSSQQMQPHSGLLQLQCLHNIMLKPLRAESFLTLACPGIASVWPFTNPRKFYSWRKEKQLIQHGLQIVCVINVMP